MVVFAESKAIGRVVIGDHVERDDVGGVHKSQVTDFGQLDTESAGGALTVVNFEDLAAEGGVATRTKGCPVGRFWIGFSGTTGGRCSSSWKFFAPTVLG